MAYKRKTIREKFRPAGGSGLSIDVTWGAKFTPRLIRAWRPVAHMGGVWGFHIRERVRDRKKGPTGQKLGPGVLSGGMWEGLKVSIKGSRGGKGALVEFGRTSHPYRRNSKGEIVRKMRRRERGKPAKLAKRVKNRFKALAVSGLLRGMTKAAGGGPPTMILTPSQSEADAATSYIRDGVERRGMEGNMQSRKPPSGGDRRLLAKLRRSL